MEENYYIGFFADSDYKVISCTDLEKTPSITVFFDETHIWLLREPKEGELMQYTLPPAEKDEYGISWYIELDDIFEQILRNRNLLDKDIPFCVQNNPDYISCYPCKAKDVALEKDLFKKLNKL